MSTVLTARPAGAESEWASDAVAAQIAAPGWADGDGGPALLLTRGPGAPARLSVFADAVTVLGRHDACTLVLPDVTASRRHAEIRPDGNRFVLTDTGSLNGSYVNRQPVDSVELREGDEIALGVFRLTFTLGATSEVAGKPAVFGAVPSHDQVGCL
ncbi:MAG TPA: FHA domain-containing protein [Pseudonocardia sp.]